MAEEEHGIIPKPKLSIFQQLKKRSVIRSITQEQYDSGNVPDYLIGDIDVLCAIVRKTPEYISRLSIEQQKAVLQMAPDIFSKLPANKISIKVSIIENFPEYIEGIFSTLSISDQILVIEKYPEYITRLSSDHAKSFVLTKIKDYAYEAKLEGARCLKYLPKELQFELLTKEVEFYEKMYLNRIDFTRNKVDPRSFINFLEYFDQDVVVNAVETLLGEAKKQQAYSWQDKKKKVPLLSDMIIDKLPIETQIKIAALDNDFIEKMSIEAALELAKQNPMVFKMLSLEAKAELVKQRPEFYEILSFEEKSKMAKEFGDIRDSISEESKIVCDINSDRQVRSTDVEGVKRAILIFNEFGYKDLVKSYCRDEMMLEEIARFSPITLRVSRYHDNCNEIIDTTFKIFRKQTDNPEILEELDKVQSNKNKIIEDNIVLSSLAKVLLNKKVMSTVDPKLIAAFVREQNMDTLKEIVGAAYGKTALQILNDRPWLTVELIPNLDIFDEDVIEKFGIGTVHSFLTYDSKSPYIMGELVRNPGELDKFEQFSKICGERFDDSASNLNKQLLLFMKHREFFNKLDFSNLTDKQKTNLLLMVNDSSMTYRENESTCIGFGDVEDLEHYDEKRKKMYDEYAEVASTANEMKDAIMRRFFGIPYYRDYGDAYISNNISAKELVEVFNLDTFINDERTHSSELFSGNELDVLELINIILKINDVKVLKEIYRALSEKEKEILNPLEFGRTKEKVPEQYSKELIDSLLTFEQAKQRASSGENGISYIQEDDGQEIIELTGADFRMLIHSTAQGITNSGVGVPTGVNISDIWKYFEDGISTISGCVIEGGMLSSCHNMDRTNGVNLGFCTVPAKQILGMSHFDAHVTHDRRSLDPFFQYGKVQFNYPDELVRKTAAQIAGIEDNDPMHSYNEVAMYRNNIHMREIGEQSYGGKIMPDYIVVYGTILPKHREVAKRLGKDGKPLPIIRIDMERYRYNPNTKTYGGLYTRAYQKEDHTATRSSGPIVQETRDMLEK